MTTVLVGVALVAVLCAAVAWMFGFERTARRLGTGALVVGLAPILIETLVGCLSHGRPESCDGASWGGGLALTLGIVGLGRFVVWWWTHTRDERSRRAQARDRAERAVRRRLPPPHEQIGEP